jgi:predicted phage terminase large subunit-like protein
VADDLLSGIEEAKNPERLDTVWGKYDNNFMKRLKGKAKLINMGTRWAVKDPQGRRLELLENRPEYANRRFEAVSIPALNEIEESNFDYPYHLGYSTADYKMIRASFEENDDMASWYAQDQQKPIERLGSLFEDGGMRFFSPDELPQDKVPDRIFMSCDEAFGGGDYVSAPVCYQFDEDYYIVDAVFNNGDKSITQPRIVETILKWNTQAIQFEETKTTVSYRTEIETELKEKHKYKLNSYGKPTPGKLGKVNRILDKAPEIRKMYFLEEKYRSKEYKKFVQNIYEFNKEGKVKHDDAPDSLAMLCDMKYNSCGKVTATKNPFMR